MQGQDIRPITLIAGNRYEFSVKATNQAGDLDIFVISNQNQDLAKDDGVAADAFVDFTAPYSGLYRIDVFNAGLMPNQGTVTVTDKGVSPNPPNQAIAWKPDNKMPKNGQPRSSCHPCRNRSLRHAARHQSALPDAEAARMATASSSKSPVTCFRSSRLPGRKNRLADVDIVGFTVVPNTFRDTSSRRRRLQSACQLGVGKFVKNDFLMNCAPADLLDPSRRKDGELVRSGSCPTRSPSRPSRVTTVVGGATLRTRPFT